MNTFVRWLIGLLFILALSIFLLILALPVLVDPNDYKNRITDLVREKTGRELVIHGNIQLQISSWLNVTCAIGKTRLNGNARFANSPFLESEQTKIELSLWPLLLQRQLHMTSIMLDDVTLHLLRNKEGVSNWENLPNQAAPAPETDTAAQETAALTRDRIETILARLFLGVTGLDIGRLQLSDVTVRYDNRQSDSIITLHNLKIKTGRLREKVPFPFEADCDLTLDQRTGGKPSIIRSGDIAVQGNATLFLQDPHLLLEDLRLDGAVKGKNLPKRGLKFTLATNSDIHLQQQKITIKDFSLTHEDAILQGNGILEDFSSPRFTISLKIPEFSPQTLLKQLKPSLPLWHNADALTHLRAELQVKGNMEETEITDLAVTVDETTTTGTIKIKDLLHPDYEAFLQVDHLDLDRYARKKAAPPVIQELESTSVADNEQKEASPPIIPVRLFKTLPLQLDLHIESLKIGGANVSQAQIKVDSKEGIVQLTPLTANLYGGTLNLEARIDVTGDMPQVQVKSKITKVQLAQLRQDMTGTKDVTGTALIQAEINTSGLSRKDLRSHMNGTLRIELLNSEITPLTILPVIRTSLRPDQTITPVLTEEGTRFTRLSGSGILEDGILHTDDLVATSEIMQITGAGEIDFDHRQTDFILQVTLSPDLDQNADWGMTGMGGKLVPYKIFGPFTGLRQEADVEGLLPTETETQPVKELSVDESLKESTPAANSPESTPESKGQEPEGE